MNKNNTISKVQSMLNTEEFTSKSELLSQIKELGWKPVTLNYSLKVLRQQGVLLEEEKDGEIMIKLTKKQYQPAQEIKNNFRNPGYRARKSNYKKEIPELTEDQESFKKLVNDHRDDLFGKKITWIDGNGMKFPLTIAGMGDVTLRCRFFLSDFMESEPQTGALIYIPWHDGHISQLFEQVEELLTPEEELQECVNFAQMAPAK